MDYTDRVICINLTEPDGRFGSGLECKDIIKYSEFEPRLGPILINLKIFRVFMSGKFQTLSFYLRILV